MIRIDALDGVYRQKKHSDVVEMGLNFTQNVDLLRRIDCFFLIVGIFMFGNTGTGDERDDVIYYL
jgi:hypothetical protein